MKHKYKLLLLLMVMFFAPKAQADSGFIASVDVMKYTKDNLNSQFTNTQIEAVVGVIAQQIKPKYIAISVPLDDSSGYAQRWTNIIHGHGLGVIYRGTWSGIEGIYDFPKLVGTNRFPAGTFSSAASDGQSTWLGKTYQYIVNNPNLFATNDLWAILPERTEGIFQDQTSFLSYDPSIQTNYPNFFIDLDKVSAAAFAKIGKSVKVGYTANNFSEVASGWILPSLYVSQSVVSVDHYGINHTPTEMENDLRAAYKRYGKPIFLQEWGDYWNSSLPASDREQYLKSMYAVLAKLATEKILAGFNYWGGWVNDGEGVLSLTNGNYSLNSRGQILADFFKSLNPTTVVSIPPPAIPAPVQSPPPPAASSQIQPTSQLAPTPTANPPPPPMPPTVSVQPQPTSSPTTNTSAAVQNPNVPKTAKPTPKEVAVIAAPSAEISTPSQPKSDDIASIFEEIPLKAQAATQASESKAQPNKTRQNVTLYLLFISVISLSWALSRINK